MSLEKLTNKGIWCGRPPLSTTRKTFIVVGVARGGTSIVAGALCKLGLPMANATPPVFEDLRLSLAFEKQSKEKFEDVIADYNEKYDSWGWKRPSSLNALSRISRKVRNAHFIFVFRDMLSIANRNNLSMNQEVGKGLLSSLDDYRKIIKFITKTNMPSLLVSSDKVLKNKDSFLNALVDFSGLEVTMEKLEEAKSFISDEPKDYLISSRITRSKGEIDTLALKGGIVRGWSYYCLNYREAVVEVWVNGQLISTQIANKYHSSCKGSGQHPTGNCGFDVDIKELGAKPRDIVLIKVKDDVVPIYSEELAFDDWTPVNELESFVKPMGGVNYKRLKSGFLMGWARTEYPGKYAIIGIYVNGVILAMIPAVLYRESLKKNGLHPTGFIGFEFNLKKHGILPSDSIELKVENADLTLHPASFTFPELSHWLTIQELNQTDNYKASQG
ncbi:hypothetical protein VCR4J2_500113 [Vibrio coralliirubri]|uniref:hypothetical protein n=1 Tax=Vibrio coralliirubri TaxID=1516159 RepID=UPI00062EC674|nr:hypothetical protein [Vibrio coralliirubri]CDT39247.1 hypothetical protein VCR4J2_500113 [Vibrio coralliirubri]